MSWQESSCPRPVPSAATRGGDDAEAVQDFVLSYLANDLTLTAVLRELRFATTPALENTTRPVSAGSAERG